MSSEKHDCASHLSKHEGGKRHLPQPRGPHSVGFFDLMTPGDPHRGSLLRVYYPTLEQCLEEHERWPLWVDDKYVSGLLTFMQAMLYRWPSWAPKGEYLYVDKLKLFSPLVPRAGFPAVFRMINGIVHIPIIRDAQPVPEKSWPVIVFSHGMGCARFTYSQICYDLASHGFIVVAPEHRDGSACMSFYTENGHHQWIHHRRIESAEDEYSIRNSQAHHRAKEMMRALDVIASINKGDYVENILQADNGKSEINLSLFKGKFDLRSPILAGHSFGGATTMLGLSKDPRFKVGLILDGWLFPIRDEDLSQSVDQPLLFLNTESFLNKDNQEKMVSFSSNATSDRLSLYIRGSVHQNHIDVPFVLQKPILKKILGMHSETCPEIVMNLTNKLMVQFIRKQLQLSPDAEIDCDLEKQGHLLITGFDAKFS